MNDQFFENELSKVQARFNRIYRHQSVFNKGLHCNVILAIIYLGLLCEKIARAPAENFNRKDKARFIQTRDRLLNIFKQIENKERRYYDRKSKLKYRYQARCMHPLWQSLPGHFAQVE